MNENNTTKLTNHFSKYPSHNYSKGSIITLANQNPDFISFLEAGLVEQYHITPHGDKLTVNVFKPYSFFPMSWAINGTPNLYFYGAITDVVIRQSDLNETLKFIKSNSDVMYDLLSRVYIGTDGLLRRLVIAANGVASNRLIYEILLESYRFGEKTEDDLIILNIKQNDLAARSGLARETVSREINKLEKDKLIVKSNKGLVIDINKLERILNYNI